MNEVTFEHISHFPEGLVLAPGQNLDARFKVTNLGERDCHVG